MLDWIDRRWHLSWDVMHSITTAGPPPSIVPYPYTPHHSIIDHLHICEYTRRGQSWSSMPVGEAADTFFTPAKLDHQVGTLSCYIILYPYICVYVCVCA